MIGTSLLSTPSQDTRKLEKKSSIKYSLFNRIEIPFKPVRVTFREQNIDQTDNKHLRSQTRLRHGYRPLQWLTGVQKVRTSSKAIIIIVNPYGLLSWHVSTQVPLRISSRNGISDIALLNSDSIIMLKCAINGIITNSPHLIFMIVYAQLVRFSFLYVSRLKSCTVSPVWTCCARSDQPRLKTGSPNCCYVCTRSWNCHNYVTAQINHIYKWMLSVSELEFKFP